MASGHPPSEASSTVSTEREWARGAGPGHKQGHSILDGVFTVCGGIIGKTIARNTSNMGYAQNFRNSPVRVVWIIDNWNR